MDKYIGKKLDGRYEIQQLIGVGGMANVYKAKDILEGTEVAVKILKDEFAQSEDFVRRFKNESKAISLLNHPNIVKVFDVSFTDRVQFIVMELIEGITLKEYIEQQGALPWKDAIHFTVQILRALQHAHDKGIVHRDIKPQNIMLLRDGTIKVMDFGIARFARNENHTVTDKAIGSVHYISPEQAQGERADQRSDIYSVGVILFEMLTGSLPFEADSAVSVAIKQIADMPKKPRELNPDIPEGLEEIILKAMQKDYKERYQSASEMLRDIDEFKQDPSIHFEYTYMTADEPTKYMDVVGKQSPDKAASKDVKKPGDKKQRTISPIMILAGVTCAFVIVATVLVVVIMRGFWPSGGTNDIVLPNLIGQRLEDVERNDQFKTINFELVGEEFSDEYEAGVITYQSPAGGDDRKIKEGSTVKVRISKGPNESAIPSVKNMSLKDAQDALIKAGLQVRTENKYDDNIAKGNAIGTDPAEGTVVEGGTSVVLYISEGKQPETKVLVPRLIGLQQNAAKQLLLNNKLDVGEVTTRESGQPEGEVLEVSPAEGAEVDVGTKINIVISSGKKAETKVTVVVEMPTTYPGTGTIRATLGVTIVKTQANINPSITPNWVVEVTGSGVQDLTIEFNGTLYQVFRVDFDAGTYVLTTNNAGSFTGDNSGG